MVYWMINYVGIIALGLACENVAMLIGQPWTAMWLIFWVITNVSTSFYSLELALKFYHWAMPGRCIMASSFLCDSLRQSSISLLHNFEFRNIRSNPSPAVVEASRMTFFNLHSRLGLNFGVLSAWCAVNSALFPLCCYFMRWKSEQEKKNKAATVRKNDFSTFLLFALYWDMFE